MEGLHMRMLMKIFLGTVIWVSLLGAHGVVLDNNAQSATATLTGVVWWDQNGNGLQDEVAKGIANIRVHLYKNGEDTAEVVLTQTAGVGRYRFENLEPNANYTVKIDLPKNYKDFTLQNIGGDDTKDSDIVNWVWRSDKLYLKAGQTGVLDAGLICKVCAQLHMEKYTNDVLVQDPADIPQIKVGQKVTWKYIIYNDSTTVIIDDINVTDNKEGTINCPQTTLAPGESMECSKEGIAKEGAYSNMGRVTGSTPDKNLTDEYPSNYFGVHAAVDIEKLTNGSDADSAPGETLGVGDSVVWQYVVTNSGNVELKNIEVVDNKEGAITCPQDRLDVNESMTCTKNGTVQEGAYENEATVTATSDHGGDVTDTDLSHYTGVSACLGDFMWYDKNLNGLQDSGEPGVVGIGVGLYNQSGQLLATTTTDANGRYKFCGLKPGSYKVKFDQPNTYLFIPKDQGSDMKDSDVDSAGWSQTVTLDAGESNMSIDAGIYCECDDYLVNPTEYKKDSASVSSVSMLVLFAVLYIAVLTLRNRGE